MRLLPLLFVALLTAGCATAPKPTIAPERAWSARQEALSGVEQWRLSGRIAVKTGEEAGHAHLQWRQDEDEYDIRLTAPFGSGTVRLAGDTADAALWVDQAAPVYSSNPEQLLYRQTGWWIPVGALRYWILGLPAPRLSSDWDLDPYGRLELLRQAGWEIRFLDYEQRDGLELPGRVFVSKGEAEVKVVVQRWNSRGPSSQAVSRGGDSG